jgi:hypothetical protein
MRHTIAIIAACAAFVFTGCKTTNPDGTKVPDKAKTEAVKAAAKGVVSFGIAESIAQFPNDAENIAKYSAAAGAVFCDMKARSAFSPEVLEAGLFALVAPEVKDEEALRYLRAARGMLLTAYEMAYAQKWKAELKPDEWEMAIAEIFCDAIDRGLKDAGKAGVK